MCPEPLFLLNIGYFTLPAVLICCAFFNQGHLCGIEVAVLFYLFVVAFPLLNLCFLITCLSSALFFRNKQRVAFVLYTTDVIFFFIVYPWFRYVSDMPFFSGVQDRLDARLPGCFVCFPLVLIGMCWVVSFCLACVVSLFLKASKGVYQKINGVFSKIVCSVFILFLLLPGINVILCFVVFPVSWVISIILDNRSDFCIRTSERDPS